MFLFFDLEISKKFVKDKLGNKIENKKISGEKIEISKIQ